MSRENPRPSLADQSSALSPLDQIRQTEADMTRQLVQAREAASKIVEEAHKQAAQALQVARLTGEQEGEARFKEILKKSEDEATALVEDARQRADSMRLSGKSQMEALVERIVKFIAGLEEGI